MGLTLESDMAYGGYSDAEVALLWEQETTEDKRAFSINRVREKINEMGFTGLVSFLWNKLRWTTSDGNFFWGKEGSFADIERNKDNVISQSLYQAGTSFDIRARTQQALWLLTLVCCTAASISAVLGKANQLTTVCQCAIIGLLLFLLIFETRSRYLLGYLPAFSILAGVGLHQMSTAVKNWIQKFATRRKPQ